MATAPLFNAYGKLQTGLVRLKLEPPDSVSETTLNAGLLPPRRKSEPPEWQEDDMVWKASRMLDQLERFEEAKVDPSERAGASNVFAEIQPVPWLDTLAKEFCHNTLKEASKKVGVRILQIAFGSL
jgi:hypothetical protein